MRDIASSCSIHSLTTRLRIPLIGRANLMRTRKSFRSLIDTSGAKTLLHTTSFETFVVMAVISAVFCVASALIPASVLLRDDFRLVAPIAAIAPLLGIGPASVQSIKADFSDNIRDYLRYVGFDHTDFLLMVLLSALPTALVSLIGSALLLSLVLGNAALATILCVVITGASVGASALFFSLTDGRKSSVGTRGASSFRPFSTLRTKWGALLLRNLRQSNRWSLFFSLILCVAATLFLSILGMPTMAVYFVARFISACILIEFFLIDDSETSRFLNGFYGTSAWTISFVGALISTAIIALGMLPALIIAPPTNPTGILFCLVSSFFLQCLMEMTVQSIIRSGHRLTLLWQVGITLLSLVPVLPELIGLVTIMNNWRRRAVDR